MTKRAGVLALQGDFAAHAKLLARLDVEAVEVRRPDQLTGLSALMLPGGESTTMSLLLDSSGLREPLRALIAGGLPVLATCAGVILLADTLEGDHGSLPVTPLGLLHATVNRNAYGRQVNSFEARLRVDWPALGAAESAADFHGVFIRAPQIAKWRADVVPVAWEGPDVVAVRQDNIVAASFHPELTADPRFHAAVLNLAN
ncbi:pyridoxal 5'-phosphate synthase glutaminase subunit PdxT [bacterium]|nr:pyridoxal 5'-phosphate synthase glutaminase subunit PdxT [bacterium]